MTRKQFATNADAQKFATANSGFVYTDGETFWWVEGTHAGIRFAEANELTLVME